MRSLLLGLACLGLLASCAKPAATDGTQAAAHPAASFDATSPYSTFELSMARIDAMLIAQSSMAAAVKQDPSLASAMKPVEGEDGVRYAQRLEATPALRAAIEKSGLTARDYVLTSEALVTALMTQEAMASGKLKAIPRGVNRQNVEFVRANREALAARFAAYQRG